MKLFTKGAVYTHVRQRRASRKEDDALAVEETGEVDQRGEKRKGKGNLAALGRSGYDSSQRLSFSVSDEEGKRVKMVNDRHV